MKFFEGIAIWNWTAEDVVYLLHDGARGGIEQSKRQLERVQKVQIGAEFLEG